MQDAVPVGAGAMAAILGLDPALVEQACAEAAEGEVVSPANLNAPGQVVIAGTAAAVARAVRARKALGARRAIPLHVSAPFHCALMQPAQDRLEPELRAIAIVAIRASRWSPTSTPSPSATPPAAIDALVRQVSAPVRWDDVMRRLVAEGVRDLHRSRDRERC